MLAYPTIAKTAKTIDKFTFNMYLSISVNMLKYNNDSSASLRLLSSLVDTSQSALEDLAYKPRFKMDGLDFISIDRLNSFPVSNIPNIEISKVGDIYTLGGLIGTSRYADASFALKYVKNIDDFVRHSLPRDMFFGEQIFSDGYQLLELPPHKKTNVGMIVENSTVTLRPYEGFFASTMYNNNSATIRLIGISATGLEVEEDIEITSNIDFKSNLEYSYITSAIAIGSTATLKVVLYPYNTGEYVYWNNDIVDRESSDLYACLLSVDQDAKQLVFNAEKNYGVGFPAQIEPYKIVDLDVSGEIINHYIDAPNSLLYVVANTTLYCFPLIIPTKYNNTIDFIKTKYQSITVEYTEDSLNREYTFYVFPVSRTNDVESLSIYINGIEHLEYSNVLLDLIRDNIETNRFVLSFDELFNGTDNALVEFRTYGIEECICPIYVTNMKLVPLYTKDLTNIPVFAAESNAGKPSPFQSCTIKYKEYLSGDLAIDANNCTLMKISSCANILLNGNKIINVFDTFTFNEADMTIVTSDTITNIGA